MCQTRSALAAAKAGKGQQLLLIVPFDPATIEWNYWKLRLKNHLFLIGVLATIHPAFLLDALTPEPFKLLVKMCKPQQPMDVPIAKLYKKVYSAYKVNTLWIAQRVNFFAMSQKEEETLISFSCDVRAGAERCNSPTEMREKHKIATFAMGLWDEITKKLFNNIEVMTLREASDSAVKSETTRRELGIDTTQLT